MWVFHDSFKTKKLAMQACKDIVQLNLAGGARVRKGGKKSRPYLLYILPVKTNA